MEDRSLEWYRARVNHDKGAISKLLDKEYLDYCKYLPRKSAPNVLVITVVLVSWTLIGMAFYTYRKATYIEPLCVLKYLHFVHNHQPEATLLALLGRQRHDEYEVTMMDDYENVIIDYVLAPSVERAAWQAMELSSHRESST